MGNVVAGIVDLFLGRLKRVNIKEVFYDSVNRHEQDFIDLNRGQLYAGQLSDGGQVAPAYKPSTIRRKRRKGQPTDRVTLKDQGKFYQGFYVKVGQKGIDLGSRDRKTIWLVNRYTDTIFGLTPANKAQVADRLRPTMQTRYRAAFFR